MIEKSMQQLGMKPTPQHSPQGQENHTPWSLFLSSKRRNFKSYRGPQHMAQLLGENSVISVIVCTKETEDDDNDSAVTYVFATVWKKKFIELWPLTHVRMMQLKRWHACIRPGQCQVWNHHASSLQTY